MTEDKTINAKQWIEKYIGESIGPNNDIYQMTVNQLVDLLRVYGKELLITAAEKAMVQENAESDEEYENEEQCIWSHSGGYIRNEHYVQVDKSSILNLIDQM